jgi:hypothetical protein
MAKQGKKLEDRDETAYGLDDNSTKSSCFLKREIEGKNKWLTLIQNAKRQQR